MVSIINWLQTALLKPVPDLYLAPLLGEAHGKLRLSPEKFLAFIQGQALIE